MKNITEGTQWKFQQYLKLYKVSFYYISIFDNIYKSERYGLQK